MSADESLDAHSMSGIFGGYPVVQGQVRLRIAGHTLEIQAAVPDAQVYLDEVLPLFRVLTDALVSVGVSDEEAVGGKVTCSKGCGACCRQLVPITVPEAMALARSMESWPEARRKRVEAGFATATRGLVESGWLKRWNDFLDHPTGGPQAFIELGLDYFRLGLPCPFLEDEACSVYEERPLICRQFLALSDPAHCQNPAPETVRTVTLPARPNSILGGMALGAGYPAAFLPLTLLLGLAAGMPSRGQKQSGMAWAEALFKALSGKDVPRPDQPSPLMAG
jgi:Fe-S-cluster containining protein